MEPYKELAAAIVERALIDYSDAITEQDKSEIDVLRSFFRSDWFDLLSDLDGNVLMRKIETIGKGKIA